MLRTCMPIDLVGLLNSAQLLESGLVSTLLKYPHMNTFLQDISKRYTELGCEY